MTDEQTELRRINWGETLPFTRIFKTFKILGTVYRHDPVSLFISSCMKRDRKIEFLCIVSKLFDLLG